MTKRRDRRPHEEDGGFILKGDGNGDTAVIAVAWLYHKVETWRRGQ